MAGFGRAPFGRGPFGRSNTGTDLIVQSFPDEYFDDSLVLDAGETLKDNNKDPLLMVLKTYANSVFQRRLDIESMPDMIDPLAAPLEIVRLFGDMLGISIDKNDPEFLQRTLLSSASQWLQIKSSKQGYSVRGLASGFDVQVTNFWRVDLSYAPYIPFRFQFFLKPPEADPDALPIFHTDHPPGSFPNTPTTEDITYAKSAYVQVVFEVHEPRIAFIDYNALLDLVILKIRDVVGIHHELLAPIFLTRFNINVNETVAIIQIDEFSIIDVSECFIYDITPADVVETDTCRPIVTITTADEYTIEVNSNFSTTIQINEFAQLPDLDLSLSLDMTAQESWNTIAQQFYVFDITPADVQNLDNDAGRVTIEIFEEEPFVLNVSFFGSSNFESESNAEFNLFLGGSTEWEFESSTNLSTNFNGSVDITIIIGP